MAWVRRRWRKIGALIGFFVLAVAEHSYRDPRQKWLSCHPIQYLATLAGTHLVDSWDPRLVPGAVNGADADADSSMTLF